MLSKNYEYKIRYKGLKMKVSITVTQGNTATDIYSQELSKNLPEVNRIKIYIPHYDLFDDKLKYFTFSRRTFNLLKEALKNNSNCIHFTSHSLASYFDLFPFVRKKILTVHDIIPHLLKEHRGHYFLNILERKNINKADHIITISQNTKKDLMKYFKIPEEKITVIYNGIDHELFYPKPERFDFPYILYVGTEEPRKNIEIILKVLYELKKEFKSLKLIKIGESGRILYRNKTLHLIKELGLENDVIFTNFIKKDDLPYYYSSAIALIFPSLYEGFGLPVLEAMACGCPVITANTSSIPEVIGDVGIMLDPNDVDGFKNAMKEILENQRLREDMIRNGIKRAKEFSWDKTAKMTVQVYKELNY